VLGRAVPLRREQAGPVGPPHAPAQEIDVRFLAGLQYPQFGVGRGEVGDEPVRVRQRPAFGRRRLVPGAPAVTVRQSVDGVERVFGDQASAVQVAFLGGVFVVAEAPAATAVVGRVFFVVKALLGAALKRGAVHWCYS
jgi:hypothetical protein